jgi:uroporphyrinogen-III synthase
VSGDGDEVAVNRLKAGGADVVAVPVYRWTAPVDATPAVRLAAAAADRRLHALTFTSAPAVRTFMDLADAAGLTDRMTQAFSTSVTVVCVGPVCAEAARQAGVADPVFPSRGRLGTMIHALTDRLAARRVSVRLGRSEGVIQGSSLVTEDAVIPLGDREGAVLACLARRPGVVVGRSALLREVWGDATDPHLVDAAVARLRRRLGPLGTHVVAVPRRGYRLA